MYNPPSVQSFGIKGRVPETILKELPAPMPLPMPLPTPPGEISLSLLGNVQEA